MPVSNDELRGLGDAARKQLARDIAEFGPRAVGATRAATRALVGGKHHRADVLHAWLRTYGTASPARAAPAPREVRAEPPPAPAGARTGGRTHLVVGDCHASPGQDLRRFADLGKYVAEVRPDVVVQIGDWYSFDSLCGHETPKKRAESRLVEEIEAGELALAAYHEALRKYGHGWQPEHHITLGNHDKRIADLANDEPWLEGLYTPGAAHEARGWKVYPYRTPARIDGIRYQHDLPSAGGPRAIGGKFHALRLLERVKFRESVVVGHSHRLDYRTEAAHAGPRVHGIVVGCYLDHVEEYAGSDNHEWWSGVVVLHDVVAGDIRSGVTFIPRHPEVSP